MNKTISSDLYGNINKYTRILDTNMTIKYTYQSCTRFKQEEGNLSLNGKCFTSCIA